MKAEKTITKSAKAAASKPVAPAKPEPAAPVRKRILPLLGKGSIQIFDMRAVLK